MAQNKVTPEQHIDRIESVIFGLTKLGNTYADIILDPEAPDDVKPGLKVAVNIIRDTGLQLVAMLEADKKARQS